MMRLISTSLILNYPITIQSGSPTTSTNDDTVFGNFLTHRDIRHPSHNMRKKNRHPRSSEEPSPEILISESNEDAGNAKSWGTWGVNCFVCSSPISEERGGQEQIRTQLLADFVLDSEFKRELKGTKGTEFINQKQKFICDSCSISAQQIWRLTEQIREIEEKLSEIVFSIKSTIRLRLETGKSISKQTVRSAAGEEFTVYLLEETNEESAVQQETPRRGSLRTLRQSKIKAREFIKLKTKGFKNNEIEGNDNVKEEESDHVDTQRKDDENFSENEIAMDSSPPAKKRGRPRKRYNSDNESDTKKLTLNNPEEKLRHRKFQCVPCDKWFFSRSSLKVHLSTSFHQPKSQQYIGDDAVCNECGKLFTHQILLKRHIERTHEGVKNHECEICSRKFYARSSLKSHLITHVDKNLRLPTESVKCPKCELMFSSSSTLQKHTRRVHDKVKNYGCTKCEYKFFTRNDRDRHLRTHNMEKTHSCNNCGKLFTNSFSWKRHVTKKLCKSTDVLESQKTKARRISPKVHCTKCDRIFSSEIARDNHLKKIHNMHVDGEQDVEVETINKLESDITEEDSHQTILIVTDPNVSCIPPVGMEVEISQF